MFFIFQKPSFFTELGLKSVLMTAVAARRLTKRALLIGNDKYEIDELQRCKNDAEDVGNRLKYCGFEINCWFNLDYIGMKDHINDFVSKITENDLIVFFYSGHGTESHDRNYLIPVKNKALVERSDRHEALAVCAQDILEKMQKKKPFALVFLLDCCRVHIEGTKSQSVRFCSTNMPLLRGSAGSLIVFACGPDQKTFNKSRNSRNSLFTYHLLEYINIPKLRIEEMMCRVCNGVFEDTGEETFTYRLSTLRMSDIYFNEVKEGKMCFYN